MDLQSAIDHGHFVPSHFRRAGLMPEGVESVPKKAFQVCSIERTRCNLASRETTQCLGVTNLPRSTQTRDQGL